MIAFVNNHFIEEYKATLQIGDLAIQRGYGIFDFFRTRNNVPLFLDDYLDRFYSSAAFLRLQPLLSRQELTGVIFELLKKNSLAESGIKMLLTGGYSMDGYEIVSPNLIINQHKIQIPSAQAFIAGISVITHEYQRDLPSVKSINYLMGVWLQQKIRDQNAADVLYHQQGIITELPRSNVFLITKDGKLVTPADNILHGITRKKLLELAVKKQYKVEMRAVSIDEIKSASEVFMTSTTKRLLPITCIDGILIGSGKAGPVTNKLSEAFMQMEEQLLLENQPV